MDGLLRFSLLFTYLQITEMMAQAETCLSQPDRAILRKTGQSVTLPCKVTSPCSAKAVRYEWYYFKGNSERVNLNHRHKYSLEGASLHIKSLGLNDSGIYHCAAIKNGEAAFGAHHVGTGTTLVVRERVKTMVRHILLWLSFALLAIYSVAIVTLILKKHQLFKRTRKTVKNDSTKNRQFRSVLQEMYNRRTFDRRQQSSNRSQAEAENTDFRSSADDIYQNV